MNSLLIIFFSVLIIVLGFLLIKQAIIRNRMFYLIDWAILSFILLYGIGFSTVYLGTVSGKSTSPYAMYISQYTTSEIIYYFILVIILICCTKLGWIINKKRENTNKKNENIKYIKNNIKYAWIMLTVSFFSYFLYSKAYGGFIGLLNYTISIRSATNVISNKYSFLEKFGQFSIISSFVFFAIVIDKEIDKEEKKGSLPGLFISLLCSTFFIYSTGGRGGMLFFILTFIMMTAYYNSKKLNTLVKKISKNIFLLPLTFITMDILWKRSGENNWLTLLINTISYPFAAFIVNFHDRNYRLFKDFIQAPFYFLPSSIWLKKMNLLTSNAQTTYLISGGYKGEEIAGKIISGTTPNDLLTFAHMQASILGVIIVGLIFGYFLKNIHIKILNERYIGLKYMFYSYFIVKFVFLVIAGGDIAQIIIGNWGFIVYFLIFNVYKKLSIL